ncbi:MAG: Biotin-protein ligase [Candidatus Saccharicenans subterraneus]|uniref:Biotin-protein ligase n=1 Tax=Candidatus Saccharicenans subterraneus TaxID=2508984 RepID=A0A3E2BQP3_9BACT|nr:MAG: Biotin-protein ligase [Candidatus Saccharicenans subterraneum]
MPVRLNNFFPGQPLFIFSLAFSTMDIARRLAGLNFPEGTAVMAEEQLAGRGTKGRSWHSARGRGLYVSFILRPSPRSLNLLPAAVGLAAAEAIQRLSGARVSLKWPNDLVVRGQKLGGILCEGSSSAGKNSWTVAGIGINLNHRQADFPRELSGQATSLFILTGKNWKAMELLGQLGSRLKVWYNAVEKGQKDFLLASYLERLSFHPGQKLLLRTGEGELAGQFLGLDEKGGLKLKVGSETRIFYASEIIRVLS